MLTLFHILVLVESQSPEEQAWFVHVSRQVVLLTHNAFFQIALASSLRNRILQ